MSAVIHRPVASLSVKCIKFTRVIHGCCCLLEGKTEDRSQKVLCNVLLTADHVCDVILIIASQRLKGKCSSRIKNQ